MKAMNGFKNAVGHLMTVIRHKHYVFRYCCMAGIPWRGIMHDLSKFSPIEFMESVRFYQGGTSSPIPAAKHNQGFSLAWQHHKGHNPHHYEYWVDNLDSGGTCIKIPFKYVKEMICDYLGAARAYNGKSFTFNDEYVWWRNKIDTCEMKMHDDTKTFLAVFFYRIKDKDRFTSKDFDIVRKMLNY